MTIRTISGIAAIPPVDTPTMLTSEPRLHRSTPSYRLRVGPVSIRRIRTPASAAFTRTMPPTPIARTPITRTPITRTPLTRMPIPFTTGGPARVCFANATVCLRCWTGIGSTNITQPSPTPIGKPILGVWNAATMPNANYVRCITKPIRCWPAAAC